MIKKEGLEIQNTFGFNLKKIRNSKGLSLRAMARNCDIDDSNISKIENGKFDVQLSTIFELAKGLNIHPKDLLDF
jgi:transcriptional regulator with XRE-family HTH domain